MQITNKLSAVQTFGPGLRNEIPALNIISTKLKNLRAHN